MEPAEIAVKPLPARGILALRASLADIDVAAVRISSCKCVIYARSLHVKAKSIVKSYQAGRIEH